MHADALTSGTRVRSTGAAALERFAALDLQEQYGTLVRSIAAPTVMGELAPLSQSSRRSATVVAATPTSVLLVPSNVYKHAIKRKQARRRPACLSVTMTRVRVSWHGGVLLHLQKIYAH